MFFCCYFQIVAHKTLTEWTRLDYEEKFCCVFKQLLCFRHGKKHANVKYSVIVMKEHGVAGLQWSSEFVQTVLKVWV